MNTARLILGEAIEEFRASLRSGVFPVAFLGLTVYVLIVLTNAEYLREMGAVGIARNAPNLIYLMTSGQMFWLIFVWAWMFGRVVMRDRDATLHEVVLSAPVSLRALVVGRWLGVSVAGWMLGLSTPLAFVVAPGLEVLGAAPAGSFGAVPWAQIVHAQFLLTVPMAFGLGALYVAAVIRSRSSAGPFAVAAVLVAMWMFSMVFVKSGGLDPVLMAVLDPSGFAAVKYQTDLWTPAQKASGSLALAPEIVASRVVWFVVPAVVGAVTLWRVRRERLLFSRSEGAVRADEGAGQAAVDGGSEGAWEGAPITSPSWGRALLGEISWHLSRTARARGVQVVTGLLGLMCVAGSFVHVVGHVEGPMVPRPYIEAEMLSEFSYMVVAFIVAGVVGGIARSDDHVGFGELFDALPTPEWVRSAGRVLSAAIVTLAIGMVPSISALVVTGLAAPASLDVGFTLSFFLIHSGPGLLELCALMLLAHAVIRPAGPAYAVSVLMIFVCVINHELGLVTYPPAKLGLPIGIVFSEFVGIAASAQQIALTAAHKLAIFGGLVALAAMAAPRGAESGLRATWAKLPARLLGPAGGTFAVCVAGLAVTSSVFHSQFVEHGGYSDAEMDDV
ncbi:MAG: ABC transporter permease, partial [Myxococcota bacterium]